MRDIVSLVLGVVWFALGTALEVHGFLAYFLSHSITGWEFLTIMGAAAGLGYEAVRCLDRIKEG